MNEDELRRQEIARTVPSDEDLEIIAIPIPREWLNEPLWKSATANGRRRWLNPEDGSFQSPRDCEDKDDIRAIEEAKAQGGAEPYENLRRELLSDAEQSAWDAVSNELSNNGD